MPTVGPGRILLDAQGRGVCSCPAPPPPDAEPLSDAEIAALVDVATILRRIDERLEREGYEIRDGHRVIRADTRSLSVQDIPDTL